MSRETIIESLKVDDILVPMTVQEMFEFKKICARKVPWSLRAVQFLSLQLRWISSFAEYHNISHEMSPQCKYFFYRHRNGQKENCTFVAIAECAQHDEVKSYKCQ